jgi:hypothetical protein
MTSLGGGGIAKPVPPWLAADDTAAIRGVEAPRRRRAAASFL